MNRNDKILREIAAQYADEHGRMLLEENDRLLQEGIVYPALGLEVKVKKGTAPRKGNRWLRVGAGLAACFALVLFSVHVFSNTGGNNIPGTNAPAPGPHAIALSFELPDGFSQSGFQQDQQQSIYYLENDLMDPVVMTLEYSRLPPDGAGLTRLEIDGETAYGTQKDGYSLLTFQKEEILYTLTCCYDVNTLVTLGAAIL